MEYVLNSLDNSSPYSAPYIHVVTCDEAKSPTSLCGLLRQGYARAGGSLRPKRSAAPPAHRGAPVLLQDAPSLQRPTTLALLKRSTDLLQRAALPEVHVSPPSPSLMPVSSIALAGQRLPSQSRSPSPDPLAQADKAGGTAAIRGKRSSLEGMSADARDEIHSTADLLVKAMATSATRSSALGEQTPRACLVEVLKAADCADRDERLARLREAIVHAMRSTYAETAQQAHALVKEGALDSSTKFTYLTSDETKGFVTDLGAALQEKAGAAPLRQRRAASDSPPRAESEKYVCEVRKQESVLVAMGWTN
jgi:hypothetical protein